MLEQIFSTFLAHKLISNNLLYGKFFKIFVNFSSVKLIIGSYFVSTRFRRQIFPLIVLSDLLL